MKRPRNYGLWLPLLSILLIGGCGIKPSKLEPPAGADKHDFPKTYPSE